ncbi:hypothetical protein BS50DRAFT_583610 [Corynespora cassiicola Philippines]|uniref:Uncharacterized protein n=1 Tax=Corynespora cassiicola Philippines TaxID=1448308 RepID=A0A2T2P2U9_CORCC|nr:hypothetical protein BS50DRAFT_583610 [Corynespora cassiicola Philippines]
MRSGSHTQSSSAQAGAGRPMRQGAKRDPDTEAGPEKRRITRWQALCMPSAAPSPDSPAGPLAGIPRPALPADRHRAPSACLFAGPLAKRRPSQPLREAHARGPPSRASLRAWLLDCLRRVAAAAADAAGSQMCALLRFVLGSAVLLLLLLLLLLLPGCQPTAARPPARPPARLRASESAWVHARAA